MCENNGVIFAVSLFLRIAEKTNRYILEEAYEYR